MYESQYDRGVRECQRRELRRQGREGRCKVLTRQRVVYALAKCALFALLPLTFPTAKDFDIASKV
eukprot:10601181-Alexandrium_andersonii.AAC.1